MLVQQAAANQRITHIARRERHMQMRAAPRCLVCQLTPVHSNAPPVLVTLSHQPAEGNGGGRMIATTSVRDSDTIACTRLLVLIIS